jgi:hypothetical protein
MKQLLLLFFVMVGLCACVAPPPFAFRSSSALTENGANAEGQATIYVIREIPKAGTIHAALVQVDHVLQGRLEPGAYLSIEVQPGIREVRIAWPVWMLGDAKEIAVKGPLEANKTYYFLMDQENEWHGTGILATTMIRQIGPDAAATRLRIYAKSLPEQGVAASSGRADVSPAPTTARAASIPTPTNSQQAMPVTTDLLDNAQKVAAQLGCGDVRSTGGNTFAAKCEGHGVAIDCDGGKCRPVHTINE